MESALRFYRHARLSFRALFGLLDPKVYIMVMVLAPLSQMLFFALLDNYVYHGVGLTGYVASNALLLCVMNAVYGIMSVVTSDRRMGTLQLVIASPANKFSVFLARSIFHVGDGLLTALLGLVVGLLILPLHLSGSDIPALIVIWLVSIFSACGIGLVLGSLGLWSSSMHLWSNVLANLLLLMSGASYPRSVLPSWLASISNGFPLTRGVTLTKQVVDHHNYAHYESLLGQEMLVGMVYFLLGFGLIRLAEYQARKRGTMDFD